ncbi:MAG: hypothetical protein LAT62_06465 [Natronospirillum sp.]|uniref:hypothetical protein n=1 Tax=Natronospirillum sp. TaxID=2812955 RepID=UPI0025EB2395|nr:hypothetical protein [Natronospirillum sp.]MCH8551560.1 hypothetical protein [Natronospirillum sp.]
MSFQPARKPFLTYRSLWIIAGLFVLTTPALAGWLLDRADQQYQASSGYSTPGTALPAAPPGLALQLPHTSMNQTHYRHSSGAVVSIYSNQLSEDQRSLVPYIPRLFDNERYTQTAGVSAEIGESNFQSVSLRQRSTGQHSTALYQFRLGPITTGSYTRAKLYQLPASFTGTRHFELMIWQMPCAAAGCESEQDRLTESVETFLAQGRSPES